MDAYDITIYKGITFSQNLTVTGSDGLPVNLSGYALSGFLKFRYSDTGKLTSLNPTGVGPTASGIVNLSIAATGTACLPVGYAFYDFQLYGTGANLASGIVIRGGLGKATIYPEITY